MVLAVDAALRYSAREGLHLPHFELHKVKLNHYT